MFKLIRHSMQELMSLSQRKRKENCIQSNSNRITIDHISQFNQNLTSFKIVICRWSGEPKKSNKKKSLKHVLTARYTASTHLYQKPIDMHTVVHNVRTKHTCDQVIIIIVSSEGLNSLLRVCVCLCIMYLSTRVILGMKLSSILLINGMTVLRPHERKSYDWWTRGAHMLTHSFSLSLSLALSHWHLINILT